MAISAVIIWHLILILSNCGCQKWRVNFWHVPLCYLNWIGHRVFWFWYKSTNFFSGLYGVPYVTDRNGSSSKNTKKFLLKLTSAKNVSNKKVQSSHDSCLDDNCQILFDIYIFLFCQKWRAGCWSIFTFDLRYPDLLLRRSRPNETVFQRLSFLDFYSNWLELLEKYSRLVSKMLNPLLTQSE